MPIDTSYPDKREALTRSAFIVVSAALFLLAWALLLPHPGLSKFDVSPRPVSSEFEPFFAEQFTSRGNTLKAHAATLYAGEKAVYAYWYGGSDEGAGDVHVYQARFKDNRWSEATAIVGPAKVQSDLHRFVRKVGNPVVYNWPDGRTWLFFVSVSVGGWAGSSINLIVSRDAGETWGDVQRLITSPFTNLSTLVRNQAIKYTDGSIGLPVYHELVGKFGEILRIDTSGRILDKTRLSNGTHSLQPVIVPLSEDNAIGLMRYSGKPPMRLLQMSSSDGGNTWSPARKLALPNPNAAVDAIKLADNQVLAVINNTVNGRSNLSLAILKHDSDWIIFHTLEVVNVSPVSHEFEFSYPSIIRDKNGIFHLLYSWNHENIKHIRFNDTWLNEKISGHLMPISAPSEIQ